MDGGQSSAKPDAHADTNLTTGDRDANTHPHEDLTAGDRNTNADTAVPIGHGDAYADDDADSPGISTPRCLRSRVLLS